MSDPIEVHDAPILGNDYCNFDACSYAAHWRALPVHLDRGFDGNPICGASDLSGPTTIDPAEVTCPECGPARAHAEIHEHMRAGRTGSEIIDRMEREHWLMFDGERRVVGCHCGFDADVDSDCGWGDSVVAHLLAVPR